MSIPINLCKCLWKKSLCDFFNKFRSASSSGRCAEGGKKDLGLDPLLAGSSDQGCDSLSNPSRFDCLPFETHPIDEFYFTATPPGSEQSLGCHWFKIKTHHSCPLGPVDLSQIVVLTCQSQRDRPVVLEKPGLVGGFHTGVA